jgi:hypothetical protein
VYIYNKVVDLMMMMLWLGWTESKEGGREKSCSGWRATSISHAIAGSYATAGYPSILTLHRRWF